MHYDIKLSADNLPSEVGAVLGMQLADLLQEAALRGDGVSFNTWLASNDKALRESLRALGEGDVPGYLVLADTVSRTITQAGNGIEILRTQINAFSKNRAKENGETEFFQLRSPSVLQRNTITAILAANDTAQPYLRGAVVGMRQAGWVTPEAEAFVGWTAGILDALKNAGVELADIPGGTMMAADLGGLLLDATLDEEGARDAVAQMGRDMVGNSVRIWKPRTRIGRREITTRRDSRQ